MPPTIPRFLRDVAVSYAAFAAFCAMLKLSTPLWGRPVWIVGSMSWLQIAIGPAIAAVCGCGSQWIVDRLEARRTQRAAAE
jgi:hypothetical protein